MGAELLGRLADWRNEGVTRVKIGLTDLDGVIRGKYLSLDKFESLARGPGGFCDCVFGWDVDDQLYDNASFTGWHTAFPDAHYVLDPSSERWLADEGVPYFIGQFVPDATSSLDGPRHAICPRARLAAVLDRAREMGFRVRAGFEYEFFVFDETPHSARDKGYRNLTPLTPGNFGYSLLRATSYADLFQGLMDQMLGLRCDLEGLHCETGPGVWEAALAPALDLEAADRAALFKTFSKAWFQRQGLLATFMAKWSMDYPGQSGHLHLSLERTDGGNVFHDPEAADGMSALQRHFVGGLAAHLPALLAVTAPTINSWTRLVKGAWAPTAVTWGVENRTAALRVLGGSPKSQRVEFRVGSADGNPYLVLAAVLAAGLDGVANATAPPAPVSGNAYAAQEHLPAEAQFPTNLRDATARFAASDTARGWFGDAFVEHWVASREWECREYERHVNSWQLERYFEII